MVKEKGKRGRPTLYTPELGEEICGRISSGRLLIHICRDDDDVPSAATVYSWLGDGRHPEFLENYRRARDAFSDQMSESIIDISDDGTNDYMEKFDKDGVSQGWVLNGEHVQRSKLRVDSRKWYMSKVAPKKYGDKLVTEHTGKDGGAIETITTLNIIDMDPAARAALKKALKPALEKGET